MKPPVLREAAIEPERLLRVALFLDPLVAKRLPLFVRVREAERRFEVESRGEPELYPKGAARRLDEEEPLRVDREDRLPEFRDPEPMLRLRELPRDDVPRVVRPPLRLIFELRRLEPENPRDREERVARVPREIEVERPAELDRREGENDRVDPTRPALRDPPEEPREIEREEDLDPPMPIR